MLFMEHRKGDPDHLDGRVTVYANIDIDTADLMAMKHPIASMVHNGLLVAQGNFREQNSLRDFLKSEMGLSMDDDIGEGLSELVDRMSGVESAMDSRKLKDHLENMGDFEEFIPTPAKVVPFHSEQEIMSQEGDVFYTGTFKNIGNAVLSVNAVPIVYQARFREQELLHVRNEIESLIAQIEQSGTVESAVRATVESVEGRLLKEFIPAMLYCRKEKIQLDAVIERLRGFLREYRFQNDVDALIGVVTGKDTLNEKDYRLLELYARKISSVVNEDFNGAEECSAAIQRLTGGASPDKPEHSS